MRKRYSVEMILLRAAELGILLVPHGDGLRITAPAGVVTEQARAVLREYRQELLNVLHAQEEPMPLCCVCLQDNQWMVAPFEHEGWLYCEKHFLAQTTPVEELIRAEVLSHPVVLKVLSMFNAQITEIAIKPGFEQRERSRMPRPSHL